MNRETYRLVFISIYLKLRDISNCLEETTHLDDSTVRDKSIQVKYHPLIYMVGMLSRLTDISVLEVHRIEDTLIHQTFYCFTILLVPKHFEAR